MTKLPSIFLLSDSTGETLSAATKAVASQYPGMGVRVEVFPFVRNILRARELAAKIRDEADLVVYTIVDDEISEVIRQACTQKSIPAIALLAPLFTAFDQLNPEHRASQPGMQYNVDREYLERVSALDYAISHDDGLSADYLKRADVILVGVSRTSKTPTCIYLAYQGIRAANVPLIRGQGLPEGLKQALEAGVPAVGLIASASRLMNVRKLRLQALERSEIVEYTSRDEIQEELTVARLIFDRYGIPVIDVTRRSIEETAAAIRNILQER